MIAMRSYASVSSKTTSVPKDLLIPTSAQTRGSIYSVAGLVNIARDFLILHPSNVRVLQPFYIKVEPVEEVFVATSSISDVYELGETFTQAVTNCLYSLVDEVIWLQEHKESLSPAMLKDLDKLLFHLRLV